MAADSLHKFVPRAPRYVLRPQDRHVMRYSLQNTIGEGGIHSTILLNLSETGAAFLIDHTQAPHIGERIKVEIPVPDADQIAWWGRVVRVHEYEPSAWAFGKDPFHETPKVIVGIKFEELPQPFTREIRKSVEKSLLKAMRDQQYRTFRYYHTLFLQNVTQVAICIALIAFTAWFIYFFTRPSANYDPKRGTIWGDRYKIF